MMNEFDEASLARMVQRHGIGDVLLSLARYCEKECDKAALRIRQVEWDLCCQTCKEAAEVAAGMEAFDA
jgi:hypothetical protein